MSTTDAKVQVEKLVNEPRHSIEIEYCVPCDFRPQAIELAREVVDGWSERLVDIRLVPSSGGRFEVSLDGEIIFSKAALDRHPDAGEIAGLLSERIGDPWTIGAIS